MEIYVVEYNGNRIGTYLDYEQAETFILSCLQSKLMTNYAYILTFKTNSCYYINQTKIVLNSVLNQDKNIKSKIKTDSPSSIESSSTTATTQSESESESYIMMKKNKNDMQKKLSQNKVKLQHKINLLKVQKERIEESKNVYENDLKLFNIFSEELKKDDNYVISELFKKKFDLFKKLENENRLSWDNFVKEFQHENFYNQHFEVNSFDKVFESLKDKDDETSSDSESDLSEEFEINSESE
jgi:hypothetical protein